MALDKPLKRNTAASGYTEITPAQVSTGVSDADRLIATGPDGKIDDSFLNVDATNNFTASEAISARAMVSIHNSSGEKVRNADANSAIPIDGYAPSAIANAAVGAVKFAKGSILAGFSGLTPGAVYYLDPAVPGGIITPSPTLTTGQLWQTVGRAISATELDFAPGEPVTVA